MTEFIYGKYDTPEPPITGNPAEQERQEFGAQVYLELTQQIDGPFKDRFDNAQDLKELFQFRDELLKALVTKITQDNGVRPDINRVNTIMIDLLVIMKRDEFRAGLTKKQADITLAKDLVEKTKNANGITAADFASITEWSTLDPAVADSAFQDLFVLLADGYTQLSDYKTYLQRYNFGDFTATAVALYDHYYKRVGVKDPGIEAYQKGLEGAGNDVKSWNETIALVERDYKTYTDATSSDDDKKDALKELQTRRTIFQTVIKDYLQYLNSGKVAAGAAWNMLVGYLTSLNKWVEDIFSQSTSEETDVTFSKQGEWITTTLLADGEMVVSLDDLAELLTVFQKKKYLDETDRSLLVHLRDFFRKTTATMALTDDQKKVIAAIEGQFAEVEKIQAGNKGFEELGTVFETNFNWTEYMAKYNWDFAVLSDQFNKYLNFLMDWSGDPSQPKPLDGKIIDDWNIKDISDYQKNVKLCWMRLVDFRNLNISEVDKDKSETLSRLKILISNRIAFYNFHFDNRETNGGVKHQEIINNKGSFDYKTFGGEKFDSWRYKMADVIPYRGTRSEIKGSLYQFPIIALIRNQAVEFIRKKVSANGGRRFTTGTLGGRYGEFAQFLWDGGNYNAEASQATTRTWDGFKNFDIPNTWVSPTGDEHLTRLQFDVIYDFISIDLLDVAFQSERAVGSSLPFGLNDKGGAIDLGQGASASSWTDALGQMQAILYELNNKVASTNENVGLIALFKEDDIKKFAGKFSTESALGEKWHRWYDYLATFFPGRDKDVVLGQLSKDFEDWHFPSLTEAIENGWCVVSADYYTSVVGFVTLFSKLNKIMEDVKKKPVIWTESAHPEETRNEQMKAAASEVSKFFSESLGKIKLIQGGWNGVEDVVTLMTKFYLGLIYRKYAPPIPGLAETLKGGKIAEPLTAEIAMGIWNATTVSTMDGTLVDAKEYKLQLIMSLYEEKNGTPVDLTTWTATQKSDLMDLLASGDMHHILEHFSEHYKPAEFLLSKAAVKEKLEQAHHEKHRRTIRRGFLGKTAERWDNFQHWLMGKGLDWLLPTGKKKGGDKH